MTNERDTFYAISPYGFIDWLKVSDLFVIEVSYYNWPVVFIYKLLLFIVYL